MFLSDSERGLKAGENEEAAQRSPLSRWLPYLAYDADKAEYINGDNTIGYLYECSPLTFLSEKSSKSIASLLRQDLEPDAVLSFMLFSDDNLEPVKQAHFNGIQRTDPVSVEAAKRYVSYLESDQIREQLAGMRVRNLRLLVSVKSGKPLSDDMRAQLEESLGAAGLFPKPVKPEGLLECLRRLFNHGQGKITGKHDPARFIRDQIIRAETPVTVGKSLLQIGNRVAGCLTPKTLNNFDSLDINSLLGGYMGREDDSAQLSQDFLWTANVFFRTTKERVNNKASAMLTLRGGGALAKEFYRRIEELNWVADDVKDNKYCDVITSFWVFGDNAKDASNGLVRARNLWEKAEFEMQREQDALLTPMFIQALPFGLYLGKDFKDVATLDREFPMSVKAASKILPIQGDFSGSSRPAMMLVGRKGQLVSLDVFDPRSNNHNFLICAGSGAGKSFFNNFLVSNYYASGALIRLVDIGYSYEKQALLRNGRFIDVAKTKGLVLNPFESNGSGDQEDFEANRATVAKIIMAMLFNQAGPAYITPTQQTLMKYAVDFAYERDGGEMGIAHVSEYLREYPKYAKPEQTLEQVTPIAHEMAFNLADWVPGGRYGAMFNGKSTFNIKNDEFVVLELEALLPDPELFSVVALQVMNAITQDLYLSDRSQKRFMLFDEAWKYLVREEGQASGVTAAISDIIEEGYRRARKYGGSTGIVTQSPLDLGKMGKAGEVIKSNAAYKMWLQCDNEDWQLAADRKIVSYSGLKYDLAASVLSNRPKYSEVFFDTPMDVGVARLSVDPWTYLVNSSDAADYNRFKVELERCGDPIAAINNLVGV